MMTEENKEHEDTLLQMYLSPDFTRKSVTAYSDGEVEERNSGVRKTLDQHEHQKCDCNKYSTEELIAQLDKFDLYQEQIEELKQEISKL